MDEEQKSTEAELIKQTSAQLERVLGDSGTTRYGGYLMEEPNVVWREEARIDTVEEMRRTDGAVRAVLNGMKAPILSTEWSVFSYDDSPQGEKIRAYVEQDIFNMRRAWRDWLREALAYLDFGHYAFELIFGIKNGQIHLVDLSPRIPASILKWQIDDKRPGITQLIRTDESKDFEAQIPMDKLLVLTNEKEGDDITGQSILRAAYIHWKYKNVLYRVSGIAADRHGVGVPVVNLPQVYGEAEKAAAVEMAENYRAHENNHIILPSGFEFKIVAPDGNPMGQQIDSLIDHHNRMITMSVLEQFLGLGSDGVGSLALSQDQSSFFLLHAEDKAHYLASQFNEQVIKRLVILAFGEQETYPELRFTPLGDKNLKESAEMLNVLTMAGLLDIDVPLKQWIRQYHKLPELTDEQIEEMLRGQEKEKADAVAEEKAEIEEAKKPESEDDDTEEPEDEEPEAELTEKKTVFLAERPLKLPRKLTEQEDRVGIQKLNENFNSWESDLEDEMAKATSSEIDRYADAVKTKLDAGDIAGIAGLSFMLLGSAKKAIDKAVKTAYDTGKTGAAKELGIVRPSTPLLNTQIMAMDINDWARGFVYELEQRARALIKDAVISEASSSAVANAVKSKAKDDAARMITNMSGTVVGQYVNRGRSNVFQSNLTKITSFQRSEVLDIATCEMCLSLDGKVIKADDPMAQMDIVHTHCRGLWVPIFESDDSQPDVTGLPSKITDSFDLVDGRPTVNAFKQLKKPVSPGTEKARDLVRRKMGV